MVRVRVRVLPHGEGLPPPARATAGAAGLDVRAAIDVAVDIPPGRRVLVPTGLCLGIPHGWEAQVRPRSGLAWKHGVTVINSPGTIDADYRGELFVPIVNLGEVAYTLTRGERIAQLVFAPVPDVAIELVDTIEDTPRGEGGFGSTGRQ